MKPCIVCHIMRPLTDFWPSYNTPDGLAERCKQCRKMGLEGDDEWLSTDVPGEWRLRGACRSPLVPTEWFFVERGQEATKARAVCATCEVKQECLDYALDQPWRLQGMWGGTTGQERRAMRSHRIRRAV